MAMFLVSLLLLEPVCVCLYVCRCVCAFLFLSVSVFAVILGFLFAALEQDVVSAIQRVLIVAYVTEPLPSFLRRPDPVLAERASTSAPNNFSADFQPKLALAVGPVYCLHFHPEARCGRADGGRLICLFPGPYVDCSRMALISLQARALFIHRVDLQNISQAKY